MRGWEEIVARLDGPLHFRFIGQPVMACALANQERLEEHLQGLRGRDSA
jgi:hypothetical protein